MKRISATLVLILALAACGLAQTAKVMALSPEDAKKAAALNAAAVKATAELNDFHDYVAKKYLATENPNESNCFSGTIGAPSGNEVHGWLRDWNCGNFEFSEDFKFIVPQREQPKSISPYGFNCVTPGYAGQPITAKTLRLN